MLELEGTVPFENTQVLLVAMALPTATFLTCRSWQSNAIDVPVCLTFGVFNLALYCVGLEILLHGGHDRSQTTFLAGLRFDTAGAAFAVLIQSPTLIKHALGWVFLLFALLRIAADCKLIPGSGTTTMRPRGEHPPLLMLGWAITGAVSGAMSGIFGVGGPPTMLFMTMARMDKGAMRGTNQAGNIALQLIRIVMLLSTHVLRPGDPGVAVELVCLIFAGILGAVIGDQLHGNVSDRAVVRIILVLLLMGSASMIIDLKSGSRGSDIMVAAMAIVTVGSVLSFSARHLWLVVHSREADAPASPQVAARGRVGKGVVRGGALARRPPAGARLCDGALLAVPHCPADAGFWLGLTMRVLLSVAFRRGATRGARDGGRADGGAGLSLNACNSAVFLVPAAQPRPTLAGHEG